MYVQRMLKVSRGLYTGGHFKQILGKKRRKFWDLICDHDLTNNDLVPLKYTIRSLLVRLPPLHSEKKLLIEKW